MSFLKSVRWSFFVFFDLVAFPIIFWLSRPAQPVWTLAAVIAFNIGAIFSAYVTWRMK